MPVPVVTCDADKVESYSSSPQTIQLGASATESPTSWEWTILHVPPGSTANVGVKGDFTDGVATVQNPQLEIDGGVDGGYNIQAVATNGDGSSNPRNSDSQQFIIVRTPGGRIWLPPDYGYDWGEKYLNPTLRALEGGTPIPWWEWNGADLSQFDAEFVGSEVGGYDISVVSHGGVNWISMRVEWTSSPDDWLVDTSVYLPISQTPPEADYIVVADVVLDDIFNKGFIGGDTYWSDKPENTGVFVGTRANGAIGYFHGVTNSRWEELEPDATDGTTYRIYSSLLSIMFKGVTTGLPSGNSRPVLTQVWGETLSGIYNTTQECQTSHGLRLAQGTEGSSILHGLSNQHYHVLDNTVPASSPITDVGKACIGVFSSDDDAGAALFRNIRCYTFPWNLGS